MYGNTEKDVRLTLREMVRDARARSIESGGGGQQRTRELLVQAIKTDRRMDRFNSDVLADRVLESVANGSYLDLTDNIRIR
jgi:hypothetical protein